MAAITANDFAGKTTDTVGSVLARIGGATTTDGVLDAWARGRGVLDRWRSDMITALTTDSENAARIRGTWLNGEATIIAAVLAHKEIKNSPAKAQIEAELTTAHTVLAEAIAQSTAVSDDDKAWTRGVKKSKEKKPAAAAAAAPSPPPLTGTVAPSSSVALLPPASAPSAADVAVEEAAARAEQQRKAPKPEAKAEPGPPEGGTAKRRFGSQIAQAAQGEEIVSFAD
jgi:hypothetical protein